MEFGPLYVILKGYKYVLFKMLIYYRREKALMPKAGDRFIVEIKPSHLGWGTHRYTDTRDPIYGEGYIKIPREYAGAFEVFNDNHTVANPRYSCVAINGSFSGILLAQGCSKAGDIYAKQFAQEGNLKGIGNWYRSVGAQVGGRVEVIFTSANSLTIEYIG